MNALPLLGTLLSFDLLHLLLGRAHLLLGPLQLPARLLGLWALLAVLLSGGVQPIAIPGPLLLEIANAVAKLVAVLLLSLELIPVPRLVGFLRGCRERRRKNQQKYCCDCHR
jgi:hypothetical protein